MLATDSTLDACNLFFLFYGIFYFNKTCMGGWKSFFLVFYFTIIAMDVFVTFVIISTKRRCISAVMEAFRRNLNTVNDPGEEDVTAISDTAERSVAETLKSSIHLNDLIEFSLGRFGRILGDLSFCLLLFLTGVANISLAATCFDFIFYEPETRNASNGTVVSLPCKDYDLSSFPVFLAVAVLPAGVAVLIIKKIHHCGVFSCLGLVCALVGTANLLVYMKQPLPTATTAAFLQDKGYEIYFFANASMQFAVWVLPIHNSMSRAHFKWMFAASCGFTASVVVVVGGFLLASSDVEISPVIAFVVTGKPVRAMVTAALMFYYLHLALPCLQLMERRVFESRVRMLTADQDGDSIFLRMRISQNAQIRKHEIHRTYDTSEYPKSRYILRFFVVAFQSALACLCLYRPEITFVLLVIIISAALFIGCVLPTALLLSRPLKAVSWVVRLVGVVLLLLSLGMTALGYTSGVFHFEKYLSAKFCNSSAIS